MSMIATSVTGFQIPSEAILRFEGPQKSWGWGTDPVGRSVSRPYGTGNVAVRFRVLMTDGERHWWSTPFNDHILDVSQKQAIEVKFPILDAQCVQYSHWWSINHHFFRWQVAGVEIPRSQVFLADAEGRPIPGTNYASGGEEITFKEMEALASTLPDEQAQAIAWVLERGYKTQSISGKTRCRVWKRSMEDLVLHQTVPAVFLAKAGGATVDHDSVAVEI